MGKPVEAIMEDFRGSAEIKAAVDVIQEGFLKPWEKELGLALDEGKRAKIAEFFLTYGYRRFFVQGNYIDIVLGESGERLMQNKGTPFKHDFSRDWASRTFEAESYQDLLSNVGRILKELRDAASEKPSFEEQVSGALRDGTKNYKEKLHEESSKKWNAYISAESSIESLINGQIRAGLEELEQELNLSEDECKKMANLVYRGAVGYKVPDTLPVEQKWLAARPYHF